MGGAGSTDSSNVVRAQPTSRNQVVPTMEASQPTQPMEDAASLRRQLKQEREEHAKALEEAAAADRKRLDEAAVVERRRLDAEAAAERKRLDEEAASLRSRLDGEGAAERRRVAEVAAEESAGDRKRLDEDAAAARARLDEEAAAVRKLLDEAAAAQRKQLDEAAAVVRKQLDDEAAAERTRLNEESAALRTQLDEAATIVRKQLDDEAAAERTRLDEQATAERRRLNELAGALQLQLENLVARLAAGGPPAGVAPATAVAQSPGVVTRPVEPAVAAAGVGLSPAASLTAPLPEASLTAPLPAASLTAPLPAAVVLTGELVEKGPQATVAAVHAASTGADAAVAAAAEQERRRLQEAEAAALKERRKAEEEVEKDWGEEDLLASIPSTDIQLEQLPSSILDLHDGMPPHLRNAPMRLLSLDVVLNWPNIRVYEEVDVATEALELPYADVDADTWSATTILSWRWSAAKPSEYIPNFAPMSEAQFAELTAVLRRARGQGMRYVWIDWSCVPQYKSSPMVEVLRSKVFYARARAMVVLPTFVRIPADGVVRLLLTKAIRVVRSRASASPRWRIVLGLLESIQAKDTVAGREYFTRVWTLAERMARFGRPERLCHWLSLESWLGMVVDAMLQSTEDRSASEMYKRILGPEAGRRLDAVLDPLEAAVKTGSMHVSEGLEEQLAELFDLAVGIWHTSKELAEAPTKDWLVSYLLDAHAGIYQAWSEADRVWAVYSYFCWKQLDQRSEAGLLEAVQDLVRVAGGSRRLLMAMTTKLGLARKLPPAEADKKLVVAAESGKWEEVVAALEEGAFPDYPGTNGGSALYFAAEKGNLAALKLLIKCGATVDRADVMGATALHAASAKDHSDVINALVAAGAGMEITKQGGRTPLHTAADAGNEAAVRALLRAGANKEAKDDDNKTPLYLAVLNNSNPDVVRVLLDAGANKDCRNKNGWTCIHAAAFMGNEDILRLLIHAGLDPNAVMKEEKKLTPLHVAAENGKAAAIQLLFKAGAKVDASGSLGTPLHRACVYGHVDAAKALIDCGAKIEAREPGDHKTPLMCAAHNDNPEVVKLLIAADADLEAEDKDKWEPIHFAAKADSYECCKLLKAAGASTKHKTKGGNYPADLAKSTRVRNILPDGRGLLEAGGGALLKALF